MNLSAGPQQSIDTKEHDRITLMIYNFDSWMGDILDDRWLMGNLANLVVNPLDPFKPYERVGSDFDEIMDGTYWENSINYLKNHPTNPLMPYDFVVMLIKYADKTGTDWMQRYSVEPWIFTFAFIRRALQNLPQFW